MNFLKEANVSILANMFYIVNNQHGTTGTTAGRSDLIILTQTLVDGFNQILRS